MKSSRGFKGKIFAISLILERVTPSKASIVCRLGFKKWAELCDCFGNIGSLFMRQRNSFGVIEQF